MIAIAKKGTKKIVKGARYEISWLHNTGTRGKVGIKIGDGEYTKGYCSYNFMDTNGNPLPLIDWSETKKQVVVLTFEALKIGDVIVCKSDRFLTLNKNSKYRISDLKVTQKEVESYNGKKYTHTDKKIKFDGLNRYFDFSPWKFRALSIDESRELSLSSVLDNVDVSCVVTSDRKIDQMDVSSRNIELIKALSKSIMDSSRHQLDIIDWACQKSNSNLKLQRDDFKPLLKLSFKEILRISEK
jgi:hypothetical protein